MIKIPSYHGKFNGQGMLTLSFDDGREDNYRVAYPIMKEYGLLGTIHVTTGWIDGTWTPPDGSWPSAVGGPATREQLEEMYEYGIEMSSHGDEHKNNETDLINCVRKLRGWGFKRVEGHASPGSNLTIENLDEKRQWFINAGLTYARSGTSLFATSGNDVKNNMSYPPRHNYRLTSQVITHHRTIANITETIYDAIYNKRWCILMLHSILYPEDPGYGGDLYYWDVSRFESLCRTLSKIPHRDLLVVTMRDGVQYANGWQKEAPVIISGRQRQKESPKQLRNTITSNHIVTQ